MSIVVPAHNEAQVIGRLLDRLLAGAAADELEVIVVPNGCTDRTAETASAYGPPVRVVESPEASKAAALKLGDAQAQGFPRFYVDADVELGVADLRALARALDAPGVLAAAPERQLEMSGRSWLVRSYYRVWTRLPEVRRGLFGRGVIAVTEEGHRRLADLPPVIADDLASSLAFAVEERVVVPGALVTVRPPRTFADLMRRRVRAATGVNQLEKNGLNQPGGSARTSVKDLLGMARREPALAPSLAVFLGAAVCARLRARSSGARQTWQRDESSRT